MSDAHSSDAMKNLVMLMIVLAMAGTVLAFLFTLTIAQPQQNVQAPANYGYCDPIIVEAVQRCARTDCNLCLAMAETSFECEVPANDKIAICGSR